MSLRRWCFAPMIIALAACADVTAPEAHTPEDAVPRATSGSGFDIHAQVGIPANKTCGHTALYDANVVTGDWAVGGVLVAQGVTGIDYTNTGSAVSRFLRQLQRRNVLGVLYQPQQSEPEMECLSLGTG